MLTQTVYAVGALLVFALAVLACTQAGRVGVMLAPIVWLFGVTVFVVPTEVCAGDVALTFRWLWVRRSISYEEIEDVSCYDEIQLGRFREIGLAIRLQAETLYVPMKYHDRLAFWNRDPARASHTACAWILHQKSDRGARLDARTHGDAGEGRSER